jgi:hypothetical protein
VRTRPSQHLLLLSSPPLFFQYSRVQKVHGRLRQASQPLLASLIPPAELLRGGAEDFFPKSSEVNLHDAGMAMMPEFYFSEHFGNDAGILLF